MMSSVIPSEKYSCSGSPLILVKGRTAIDGRAFVTALTAASSWLLPDLPLRQWKP